MDDSATNKEVITFDEEETTNKLAEKTEDKKETLRRTITELKEELAKSERLTEKAIKIGGEHMYQAEVSEKRVKILEEIIEKNPTVDPQNEELKKSVSDLEKLLEDERMENEEVGKNIADLRNKLKEEIEGRKRDQKRIDELKIEEGTRPENQQKLEEIMQKAVKADEKLADLTKREADLNTQLTVERNGGNEDLKRCLEDRIRDQKKAEVLLLNLGSVRIEKDLLARRLNEEQKEKVEMQMRLNEMEKTVQVSTHNDEPIEVIDLTEDDLEMGDQAVDPSNDLQFEDSVVGDHFIENEEQENSKNNLMVASTPLNIRVPNEMMNGEGGAEEGDETKEASILHDASSDDENSTAYSMEMHEQADNPFDIPDLQFEDSMAGDHLIKNEEQDNSMNILKDSFEADINDHSMIFSMTPAESAKMGRRARSMKKTEPMDDTDSEEGGPSVKKWIPVYKRGEGFNAGAMGKRRTPARSINYSEPMDGSDMEEKPSMKMIKTENVQTMKSSGSSELKPVKKEYSDNNDLQCPECEYATKSVAGLESHLRRQHSTTVLKSGYALLCDCGIVCYSEKHCRVCEISNFTLIRETDKTMKTLGSSALKPVKKEYSDKNQLQCPKCDYITKSVAGLESHFRQKHSTTVRKIGYALLCDCGIVCYSEKHCRVCEISNFTLIRETDKSIPVTPQCVSCETHPSTIGGYSYHLSRHHKTTLIKEGIFLDCSCGFKYTTKDDYKKHDKKCAGDEFTLHKIDED